jgi:hypothetical protein
MDNCALVLSNVAALGALVAALAAWMAVRETKRASEGQLFSSLFAEYGCLEMLDALRVLRNWMTEKGPDFAAKWKMALQASDSSAHEVDRARRRVQHYFVRALRLHEAGYASLKLLRSLCVVDGINILYDVVEPLEAELNEHYDHRAFSKLKKLCGGTEAVIAPVSAPPQ